MAKMYFHYSTMNAGKSAQLLQSAYNYTERGMTPYLLTSSLDDRYGKGKIGSRTGIECPSETFTQSENLFNKLDKVSPEPCCIFVDEAQFLTRDQVRQLAHVVDEWSIPVMCYGLRTDFKGDLFEGSSELLAISDVIKEIKTICHCGKKAIMTARVDNNGNKLSYGDQVSIGGNDQYVAYCRKHWLG